MLESGIGPLRKILQRKRISAFRGTPDVAEKARHVAV